MPSTDSGMTSLKTLPPKDGYGPGVRTHQLTVTVKRLTLSYLYLPLP